ncbi:MAG: flagellar biosynthesis protein FlhF, partial [Firmicutes bacterium]|nr:flagellar biosynthesis protein FlhF [Bacillota bacterium]
MIVKRFHGKTAESALLLAKNEFGEDAVILSSGRVRPHWWKFWERPFQVLVAADYQPAADVSPISAAEKTPIPPEDSVQENRL